MAHGSFTQRAPWVNRGMAVDVAHLETALGRRADRSRDRGSPRRLVGAAARAHARRVGRAIRRRGQPRSSRSRLPRRHPQRLRDPARADDRRRLPPDPGDPEDRRRRRLGRARQPRHRPRAHGHHGRSLVGRLDPRGRARDSGPRRDPARRLPRLEALAARRVHAVRDLRRVRHLPRQRASSSTATAPT